MKMKTHNKQAVILEDVPIEAHSVAEIARSAGLEPRIFANGKEALEYLLDPPVIREERVAIVIADRILSPNPTDPTGDDVLFAIRQAGLNTPFIILTGNRTDRSVVDCFANGTDDYVEKPFSSLELLARIKARIREKNTERPVIEFDGIRFDTDTDRITCGEKTLTLQPLQYRMLEHLLRAKKMTLSPNELVRLVYGSSVAVTDHTLNNRISDINTRFRSAGAWKIIRYRKGIGYVIQRRQDDALA